MQAAAWLSVEGRRLLAGAADTLPGGILAFTQADNTTAAPGNPDTQPAGLAPGGPGREGGAGQEIIGRDVIRQVVAGTLGLTVEEPEAAHEEGVRLEELAEQQGVDVETVREAVEAARAEIARSESGGPLQEGDKVTVTGITGEWQGIVVLMRHQYGLSPFPLADLAVAADSPAFRPVGDYQVWFAREKA